VVTRYNQRLLAELWKENTLDKISQLDQRSTAATDGELERLDRELTWAKSVAEQHCWKMRTGGVDWCPLITQAIQAIQYWKGWAK